MPDDLLFLRTVRVEVYHYDVPNYGRLTWDVTRAKEQVAAGFIQTPNPVEIPRAELRNLMIRCDWTEAHVAEVDPSVPGIAAPFIWGGQIIYVPIDGIHRAVRAFRDEVPFSVWLLTDAASRACIVDGPLKLLELLP